MELHPHGRGDTGSRKKTEKAAGPAKKERIWIGYQSILGGPKGADRGQLATHDGPLLERAILGYLSSIAVKYQVFEGEVFHKF